MGEKSEKTQKKQKKSGDGKVKSWFKGLRAEFRKVIWPDKNAVARQTTAVVVVSVVLGAVITVLDTVIKYGLDLLVR